MLFTLLAQMKGRVKNGPASCLYIEPKKNTAFPDQDIALSAFASASLYLATASLKLPNSLKASP